MRGDTRYDMTVKFITVTWGCYSAQMHGKPELGSKACQKIYEYMLTNVNLIVLAYRKRVYMYASATIVKRHQKPLKEWLAADGDEEEQKKREDALIALNPDGYPTMFGMIGDVIVEFMRDKGTPFPLAFRSKDAFLGYECWKRGQIWVRSLRVITGVHANKHWNNYGYANYKFGVKAVERYMLRDAEIIQASKKFQEIVAKPVAKGSPKTKNSSTPLKKRKSASGFDLSSPECPPRCKTKVVFSSDDEN